MYRKIASALLVVIAISAKYACAVSLGEMTMMSALNQPLEAEIRLTDTGDLDESQIKIQFADNEAFEKAGLERTFFHSDIKFDVELDGKGKGVVKLTSQKRVNEPFLDLLIEARWPSGKMLRAYTALVDLPVYSETESAAVDTGSRPASVTATEAAVAEKKRKQAEQKKAASTASQSTGQQESEAQPESAKPQAEKPQAAKPRTRPMNPAAVKPLADNEYRTQRHDTLWDISRQLVDDDITINQAMLAVQRTNPNAFMGNNINRLKAGVVLRLPSSQAIREISAQTASQQVAAQNKAWKGAQLDTDTTTRQTTGRPGAAGEGHLRLTSAGAGMASGKDEGEAASKLQQALNNAKDKLAAAEREKQDLNTRVDSLGNQVDQLKRMVELKDAELANLQSQLGKKPQPAEGKKAVAKAETKSAKQQPEEKTATAKTQPAEKTAAKEPVKPAKKVAESKKAEKATKKAASKKAPEPGLMDKILGMNPIYFGIPAILIVVVVVGFLLRRRTQQERQLLEDNDNFSFDDEELGSADEDLYSGGGDDLDVAAGIMEEEGDTATDEFDIGETEEAEAAEEVAEPEETTTVQTGDAISEAEIYIAYNRYDQAVELLKNAIASAPSDVALHSKLIEVCVESGDKENFQNAFIQLQSLGAEDAITHAKELLSTADAADWLDDLPAAEISSPAQEPEALAGEEDFELDTDLDEGLSLDSDLGFESLEESPADESGDASLEDEATLDLSEEFEGDLDLDSSLDELPAAEEEADLGGELSLDDMDLGEGGGEESDWSLTTEEEPTEDEAASLEDSFVSQESADEELNLDTGAGEEELSLDMGGGEEEVSLEGEGLSLDTDDLSLDLDLDETQLDNEQKAPEQEEEDVLDFDGLELDTSGLETEEEPAAEAEEEQTPEGGEDLAELSLDDLTFDEPAQQAEAETGETESATEEEDQETLSLSDFDLDFDDIEPESDEQTMVREAVTEESSPEPAVEEAPAEEAPAPVEEPAAEQPAAAPSEEPQASQPLDALGDDDLTFLSDADEVSTKLDLAQAYIDMGDIDGARDILLEVVKEGNEEQKTDASAMLDTLE